MADPQIVRGAEARPTVSPTGGVSNEGITAEQVYKLWYDIAFREFAPAQDPTAITPDLLSLNAQAQGNAGQVATIARNAFVANLGGGKSPAEAKALADQMAEGAIANVKAGRPAAAQGPNTEGVGSTAVGAVSGGNIAKAVDVFEQAYDPNRGIPYKQILEGKAPIISGRDVQGQTIGAPDLGPAARQALTTVEETNFDTGAGNQARDIQLANLADLQATAEGRGAGQQAALARMRLALQRSGQQASGLIQQARGAERRGLRRGELLRRGEAALAAETANQAQNAAERQTAQAAVGNQAGQIRTADVDVENKRATFEARRKELQAQLDSARASNDQDAINDFTKKLADLDIETKKFNAGQTQSADTSNADRDVEVAKTNAQLYQDDQRLKIEADKAKRDAAQGLLNEAQRQEAIRQANQMQARWEAEFRAARTDADRKHAQEKVQFWAGVASNLLTALVPKPPAAAAKGGLIDQPTLVAEGDHDELVIPVTGVTPALRRALAVESKPFQAPVPVGALLKAALAQSQPPQPEMPPMNWGRVVSVLAPANNARRKAAQ